MTKSHRSMHIKQITKQWAKFEYAAYNEPQIVRVLNLTHVDSYDP